MMKRTKRSLVAAAITANLIVSASGADLGGGRPVNDYRATARETTQQPRPIRQQRIGADEDMGRNIPGAADGVERPPEHRELPEKHLAAGHGSRSLHDREMT